MIEVLKEIIAKLTNNNHPKQSSKMEEIKSDFSEFYQNFNSRLDEIANNKENSQSHANNITLSAKSKMRTEVSENLLYSPSNFGNSFLGEFTDSKVNFNPTIKMGSPFNKNAMTQSLKFHLVNN